MARAILLVFALFAALLVLRGLRIFFEAFRRRDAVPRPTSTPAREAGDMVRDPVCGTWADRRLALPARRGAEIVSVCSEGCRRSLEASSCSSGLRSDAGSLRPSRARLRRRRSLRGLDAARRPDAPALAR